MSPALRNAETALTRVQRPQPGATQVVVMARAHEETIKCVVQAGKDHRDVIRQFGRFPHRNAILGRHNTGEEDAWLAVNRGGWGQGAADLEHQD